jgi:rubrerythrin
MSSYRVIKPIMDVEYLNKYYCENCEHTWHDVWDSACDDECPMCGDNIAVSDSIELKEDHFKL